MPATVRCGWSDTALLITADLDDISIGNSATLANSRTWESGDVFEIFLRPAGGKRYFEFHVTPENVQLQLHFESSEVFFSPEMQDLPHDMWRKLFLLPPDSFTSTTQVDQAANKWQVFAAIPFATMDIPAPQPGDEWATCFCRYDCTEGQSTEIYSTTGSGSKTANFHDQNTWNRLILR